MLTNYIWLLSIALGRKSEISMIVNTFKIFSMSMFSEFIVFKSSLLQSFSQEEN